MASKVTKSKKSQKSNKSFKVNKNIKLGLIIFIMLLLIGEIYLLYSTINKKYINEKVSAYSYINSAKVNYSISLLPNMLYIGKILGEGNTYIADYTDSINTKFKYEFNGERPAQVFGKYSITATVEGLLGGEKESKTVWSKEYVLQPETDFNGNDKFVSVEREIPIKLASYNSFVQQVMESTKINFDTRVTIRWNISVVAKTDKGDIREELTPTMVIPLNNKSFEISGDLSPEKKGAIEENIRGVSPTYQRKVVLCYVGIGMSAAVLLFLLIFTSSKNADDLMEKQLKQIFKHHGDRMVALSEELGGTFDRMLQVKTIDDLVRISDDIGKPILYSNRLDSDNMKKFYVIDDKLVYTLSLKSCKPKAMVVENTGSPSASTEI